MAKEAINECVEKIIAKDFTKAKAIIAEHLKNSSNNRIIAKYSPKNVDMNDSIDDFKMMNKSINSKLSSVWIDDFEKGYFSVWKVFTKNAIEELDKEGIVGNPAEKEQANEASQTSSE